MSAVHEQVKYQELECIYLLQYILILMFQSQVTRYCHISKRLDSGTSGTHEESPKIQGPQKTKRKYVECAPEFTGDRVLKKTRKCSMNAGVRGRNLVKEYRHTSRSNFRDFSNSLSQLPVISYHFPIFSLPCELISYIMRHACDATLISLFQTSHQFRPHVGRCLLRRCGVLVTKYPSTTIRVVGNIPRRLLPVLVYFGGMLGENLDVHFECDIYCLLEYFPHFSSFLRNRKVNSITLKFCLDDIKFFSKHPISFAIFSVLNSIASLSSICIEESYASYYPSDDSPLRRGKKGALDIVKGAYFEGGLDVMKGLHFLTLNLGFFCNPTLRRILTLLASGPVVINLTLHDSSQRSLTKFLSYAAFPSLVSFRATVSSSSSIIPDPGFLTRHPKLKNIQLRNFTTDVREGNSQKQGSRTRSTISIPSRLQHLKISANYSRCYMEDVSDLHSLDIHPVTSLLRIPDNRYCDAVRSSLELVRRSYTRCHFQESFVLGIYFPRKIFKHIRLMKLSEGGSCACSPRLTSESIQNVRFLRVFIDFLENETFDYLIDWMRWFPIVVDLTISCTEISLESAFTSLAKLNANCKYLKVCSLMDDVDEVIYYRGESKTHWSKK